jgi:hypothetical protein
MKVPSFIAASLSLHRTSTFYLIERLEEVIEKLDRVSVNIHYKKHCSNKNLGKPVLISCQQCFGSNWLAVITANYSNVNARNGNCACSSQISKKKFFRNTRKKNRNFCENWRVKTGLMRLLDITFDARLDF